MAFHRGLSSGFRADAFVIDGQAWQSCRVALADFLKGKGVEIDKRKVQLEEPIKKLGEHEVQVKLHPEVQARLKVLVTKEG